MIHEMLPVSDRSGAKGTHSRLTPTLVGAMWGVNRINEYGMHETAVCFGNISKDRQSLSVIPAPAHAHKAIFVRSDLCPEGVDQRPPPRIAQDHAGREGRRARLEPPKHPDYRL